MTFPEADRCDWFGPPAARRELNRGQAGFVGRLEELLRAAAE
jgi:predicted NUDIX family NTP pyrophosphohydrolase